MLNDGIVVLSRIQIGNSLVDLDFCLMITLFHKENPGIGIQISTIFRFRLDGLKTHLLRLVQLFSCK